jgi:chromosome segregation ATPase
VNDHSSRSHAIVRITVESQSETQKLTGVLNLVDLAGSECQKNTNAEGDRQIEASMINKSLLALSKLIDSLQNGRQIAVYRESKLTLYLQDSLGGTSQTVIICAINSELSQKATSENTLRFASKAMKVRNQPKVHEMITDKARIEQLVEENRILKERLASPQSTGDSDSLRIQIRRLENENDDLASAIAEIESQYDQDRAQLSQRIEALEREKEDLMCTADSQLVEVVREKEALIEEVQDLKTKLIRKEAEIKGARFTQSIVQAKLEQKDLTIIQLGQRIQAQREELKTQKVLSQQLELGTEIPVSEKKRECPDAPIFPAYESVIAQLKEKQNQFRPRDQSRKALHIPDSNVYLHPGDGKRVIGRRGAKSVLSTIRRADQLIGEDGLMANELP